MQTVFTSMCGFHRSGAIIAHQGYVRYHERCLGRHVITARQDESGYNFSRSCSSKLIKWSCAFVTHVLEYTYSYMCNTAYLIPNTICLH